MNVFGQRLSVLNWVLSSLFLCLALAGCKTVLNLEMMKPGSVTTEDVRRGHPPAREWKLADGGTTFEYPGDVDGQQSQRFNFDKDGRYVDWYLPVTLERAERVKPAMTRAEVLEILGEPNNRSISSMTGGEVWEWVLGVPSLERAQRCVVVEWHPRVDGAMRIFEDNYSR